MAVIRSSNNAFRQVKHKSMTCTEADYRPCEELRLMGCCSRELNALPTSNEGKDTNETQIDKMFYPLKERSLVFPKIQKCKNAKIRETLENNPKTTD
jgi:hypothetical protein